MTHDIEEALLLADRILILSKPPAKVIADIAVTEARPRDPIWLRSSHAVQLGQQAPFAEFPDDRDRVCANFPARVGQKRPQDCDRFVNLARGMKASERYNTTISDLRIALRSKHSTLKG